MEKIGLWDSVIFIAYFIVVTFVGFFVGRKKKETARDYFITTGRLPWYIIGFGMIASSISTEQFIGVVGFTYKHGLVIFNWEWGSIGALLILLWIFVPIYLRKRILTIPQYLELRFGPGPRTLYAVICVIMGIFIILAGVIYTGGFLLWQIFGLDKLLGMWVMALFAGAYTVYGGMISVAWTQLFQAILLLGSGILISILGILKVEGGFSAIIGAGERAHLILPTDHPELPWTVILVLAIPVSTWYLCTSQQINQSCLGAKNHWNAKMGIILAGFLWLIVPFVTEFPGLVAYALNPHLDNVDKAFPFVVKELISPGLRGFVLAGLCGAVMSTIEALVHSTSAIFTLDLFNKFKKDVSEKNLIIVGRITTATALLIATLWAPMVEKFPTIFEFFQKSWFFIAAPVATVFLLGALWKRATPKAAFWTLSFCFPLFILPYFLQAMEKNYGWQINEFNLAGVVFVLSFIFMIVISLVTEPPSAEQIKDLVWSRSMVDLPPEELTQAYPWYKNLKFWSLVLITIVVLLYCTFW